MAKIYDGRAHPLIAVHRRWAFYAMQKLALHDLTLSPSLFEKDFKFVISIGDIGSRFASVAEYFDEHIRPVTADISIVADAPSEFTPVLVKATVQDDMWSVYSPLTVSHLNQMLALIAKDVPKGGIDFVHDTCRWQFQHFGIDDAGRQAVREACAVLGIDEEIDFLEVKASLPSPGADEAARRFADSLAIGTRHSVSATNRSFRRLVERDEDSWRLFVKERTKRGAGIRKPSVGSQGFECLYDTRDDGPIQLAELLTLYDVVNVVPGPDKNWLERHGLTLADLEVMTALRRVRLVLPESILRYPEDVIQAAISNESDSLVLSRELAARVLLNGEKKDPLLYGPFTTEERTDLLRRLHEATPDDAFKTLLSTYCSSFVQHGLEYALRGANAGYRIGIGAFLGEVMYRLRGIDARIEMSVTGAAIEWSMGLGAAYVPRRIGGFDETRNASIIASHVSRSRFVPKEPLTNRMHTVVDGLLAMTGVPPVEVAQNFSSSSVSRFRQVAMKLLYEPSSVDELSEMVKKLNEDVRAFERRKDRLTKWRVDTAMVGLATKLAMDSLDSQFGPWTSYFTSLGAGYLYDTLKNSKAFDSLGGISREVADTFVGLILSPSNDAVIMSRTRANLER